ncbi:MAG: phytoene desaturase family protein [Promethearchaeota archaeon]
MYDAIVIGAGVGGLTCASKLATSGKKVIVLEKIYFIGGSSCIFSRGDFIFPMGPLSFSHPSLVQLMLKEVGVQEEITFKRSHFQLISPELDIIYSQEWSEFENQLKNKFPEESKGIETFFKEFNTVILAIQKVNEWHPDFIVGEKKKKAISELDSHSNEYEIIKKYSEIPIKTLLDKYLVNTSLKRLLGSQGTRDPIMNVVHLAFLWNVMSHEGIWFPSCAINGINELLAENIISHGGVIKRNTEVEEILIENNKAVGVRTIDKKVYRAEWIISNADYKQVFLKLIDSNKVPISHLNNVKNTPYTNSELCVYLGIDPSRVNLSNMRADHLFYHSNLDNSKTKSITDFSRKEIEICLWSNKSEKFAPDGHKSILLRASMPYEYFEKWRISDFKRREGYHEHKQELVEKLIETVEEVLPGLSSSIIVKEAATPLTYRDFICRSQGSVAGWTRDIQKIRIKSKLLSEKPFDNLLLVGIYSVLEPFLGGYPVSMYTGCLAADLILERDL